MIGIIWLIRRRSPSKVNRVFRRAQIVSGSFVAFTHGTNDAQKTMGIIALALVATGHLTPRTSTAADLGHRLVRDSRWRSARTPAAGGSSGRWAQRIAKIDPPQGFAAQTACAAILWTTAHYGFPVSTTQTISGCVIGAGASRGFSAVRWGIAGNIVVAWVFTLPLPASSGASWRWSRRIPRGDLIVFILAGAIAATAFLGRRYETRRASSRAPRSGHASALHRIDSPHGGAVVPIHECSDGDARSAREPAETLLNRELSHLEFHARVLELAADETLPLLERVKFCAIFSSNLDEFFQVRVAGLLGQAESGLTMRSADGLTPQQALARIRERVLELTGRCSRGSGSASCARRSRPKGIVDRRDRGLRREGAEAARAALRARDLSRARRRSRSARGSRSRTSRASRSRSPIFVADPETGEERFARVKIPEGLPRFLEIGGRGLYVPLEQVIAHFLPTLFPGATIVERAAFRVTRDADFEVSDDAADLLEAVESQLRRRRFGDVVRVEVSTSASSEMVDAPDRAGSTRTRRRSTASRARSTSPSSQELDVPRPARALKFEPWMPVDPSAPRGRADRPAADLRRDPPRRHRRAPALRVVPSRASRSSRRRRCGTRTSSR